MTTTQKGHQDGRTHRWKEDNRLKEESSEILQPGHLDARTNRWIGTGIEGLSVGAQQLPVKQRQSRRDSPSRRPRLSRDPLDSLGFSRPIWKRRIGTARRAKRGVFGRTNESLESRSSVMMGRRWQLESRDGSMRMVEDGQLGTKKDLLDLKERMLRSVGAEYT
ncbi:hypothetical protein B9Z55_003740 [Caenorhabditis nigoni]|uniref:Uncharacterized protein n=1 Tax=Caenorhabditis nigoni TaxID=1611254 RepID=A0A2G5VRZ1_9PELO|nr:hypothetical protein B9Z55_003740 [Caenorhabditis nigoni]